MSDVNKLQTAVDAIRARLAGERQAANWAATAASEMELQHVAGELAAAVAEDARKAAEAEAKRRADASKQAWADAQRDAESLRASWASWVAEMTTIDSRLDELAAERREMNAKALELYHRGDSLRGEPIAVAFEMPERLREVSQYRIPTMRG